MASELTPVMGILLSQLESHPQDTGAIVNILQSAALVDLEHPPGPA